MGPVVQLLETAGAPAGRYTVPAHGGIPLDRRARDQVVAEHARIDAHTAEGTFRHPLPEGGPGQPGQQVRGPAAYLGVALVQRGLEQRLIGQAQPLVRQHGQEHDPFRSGRRPALGDQFPGGGGIAGPQRGQVAAPLALTAQPPGIVAGLGERRDEHPVRVEPGQPPGPCPACLGRQAAQFRVGRRDPPDPVEQRGQQTRRDPAAAGYHRGQPFGQQVRVLAAEHPGEPAAGGRADRGSRVRFGGGERFGLEP